MTWRLEIAEIEFELLLYLLLVVHCLLSLLLLQIVVYLKTLHELLSWPQIGREDRAGEISQLFVSTNWQSESDKQMEFIEEGVIEVLRTFVYKCSQKVVSLWDVGLILGGGSMQLDYRNETRQHLETDRTLGYQII